MKRLIPKSEVEKAKRELGDNFLSRILTNVNKKECWHLSSVDGSKIVDSVVHFSEKGTKKIFFKAKRFSFEYFNGDLAEGFAVYSNCDDKYCINPNHHYSSTPKIYLKKLAESGWKPRHGFKHSPETIIKMSAAQKGKKITKQARLKMRLAKLGVKRDPEVVARTAEKYFRGENNARAKLTEKQVIKIRRFRNHSSSRELAKYYPVTHSHIRNIWRKVCWKHVV
jgi:hypothetical protein